jgi:hypothetical protein
VEVSCSKRISEGSTVKGKAMFVCSSRKIGYDFLERTLHNLVYRVYYKAIFVSKIVRPLQDHESLPKSFYNENFKSLAKKQTHHRVKIRLMALMRL